MNEKTCPTCHAPVPVNAPGGFCPACLLRGADEPEAHPTDTAPPLEEIAAAFPQFEVLGFIGQGGMGSVYQVRQPGLGRVVALKILSPALGRDPAFAERFAREARALGSLNHPNIVTIHEHGECGGFFYLLMEHVDGVNLRQAMRAGRFTPEQALAVVPGICDALQAAHAQGVWHRDIKPENILLDEHGGVKIADFGIARMAGEREWNFTLTRTGGALGSTAYMAPEQHENPRAVDHRADIYSLGVVIYEMLTGELPLGRFPAPSERAAVNARIDEIVFRTLAKERELRQQSATEVKTDVEGVAHAAEPGPDAVAKDTSKRGRLWVAFLIAGVLCFPLLWGWLGRKETMFILGLGMVAALAAGVRAWHSPAGKTLTVLASTALLAIMVWFTLPGLANHRRGPRLIPVEELPAAPREAPERQAIVNWRITLPGEGRKPAEIIEAKGRLDAGPLEGREHSALTVTVGYPHWFPLCMIIGKGKMGAHERKASGSTLQGYAELANHKVEYAISGPDRMTIGGKSRDMKQGRIFLLQPDGSLRQIKAFPKRFVPANELDDFVKALPKELSRWEPSTTAPEGNGTKVDEQKDWAPWAAYLKEGDLRRSRKDPAGALKSYDAALSYVRKQQAPDTPGWLEEETDCHIRIGDVLAEQDDLQAAASAYQLGMNCLEALLKTHPGDEQARDRLVKLYVNRGDLSAARGDTEGAHWTYMQGIAKAENLGHGWESAYPFRGSGDELARNYQAETVLRQIDEPGRDTWDLMRMIGQAGVNKDENLLPLLEREDLRKDARLAISLAGYDWSLNRNPEALEFILAKLAEKPVGAEVDEVVVLSFMDEWDRSTKAIHAHFLATDGSGDACQAAFWARRKLLFPRNYLSHRGKAGEGAPLAASSRKGPTRPFKWRVTENFKPGEKHNVLEFEGMLVPVTQNSETHAAFTVHAGGDPVFMILGEGKNNHNPRHNRSYGLYGNFDIGQEFQYSISDADRVRINNLNYDLTRGRVFLIRPDKSLRQIAMRPQHLIKNADELNSFVNTLPPGK